MSIEELYDAFNATIPVYWLDLKTRITPTSQTAKEYEFEQQVEIVGCIPYDPSLKRIYVENEDSVPDYLDFEFNELTGMWRVSINSVDMVRHRLSENTIKDGEIFTIRCVRGWGYSGFSKQKKETDIDIGIRVVDSMPFNLHLPDDFLAEIGEHNNFIGGKTVLISASCENSFFMVFRIQLLTWHQTSSRVECNLATRVVYSPMFLDMHI